MSDENKSDLEAEKSSLSGEEKDKAKPEEQPTVKIVPPTFDEKKISKLARLNYKIASGYIRYLFDLRSDTDRQGTIESITKSIEFRGVNLWTLVCAILIASIGLNTNSTAVIIGAMLISPLMGPIMGMGLAIGTNDFDLFKRSARNWLTAFTISIVVSTLYFLITPLHEAQSELLARTKPTIFDVLIALVGGIAGIIAGSRTDKATNAIPGVAIATALMPPLCTAGFGLATAQWNFFFGAFYLFFINSVFICLSTFVFVRYLKFPKKAFLDQTREKRVKSYFGVFVILTMLPSIYTAIGVVNETVFYSRANHFIREEFKCEDKKFKCEESQVINTKFTYNPENPLIEVTLIGEPLSRREINALEYRLASYGIANGVLAVKQPKKGSKELEEDFNQLNQNLRVTIVEDLYKKNEEVLREKEKEIREKERQILDLEKQIQAYQAKAVSASKLSKELAVQFPELKSFTFETLTTTDMKTLKAKATPTVITSWNDGTSKETKTKFSKLLKVRLELKELIVLEPSPSKPPAPKPTQTPTSSPETKSTKKPK